MNGNDYGGGRHVFRLVPILIGLVLIAVTGLRGCQEGPFGRHQVVNMNPKQEAALGAQAYQEVLESSPLITSGPLVSVVKRIANDLVRAAQSQSVVEYTHLQVPDFRWECNVVRSKEVNAFCLPGGKIVVYTGIIPIARTEDALAAVMGHEIGHALAHHGAERMAQEKMVQIAKGAAVGATADMGYDQQRQILGVLGAGSKFGVLLPFSRKHESEADRIGLILMAAAGYDPRQAIDFWKRMEQASGGRQPAEFMSTHPSNARRIQDIESLLPEALKFYDAAPDKHEDRLLPSVDARY